jgi:hypothetical protein
MQLRLLQTVSEVASDQNSTLVMPLPMEVMRFFEQAVGAIGGAPASTASLPTSPSSTTTSTPSTSAAVPPAPPVGAASPGREHTAADGAGR